MNSERAYYIEENGCLAPPPGVDYQTEIILDGCHPTNPTTETTDPPK
ncbi:hypothetical protein [Candidatus Nitrosocosmicus arcticus]|uniref:Uncharacterized protein n=1 Tax=Candidatus Nitrosocosmicus arcticus TaxID=2035267 RepID=A0A557SSV4_9ARCH|nr:hypothetical protein [Candidatus Nitrosocosmicus arcticus]TVP39674.1 hypothetical protein NARC_130013 [Candidatus Nitrosocosmicus arcticus]